MSDDVDLAGCFLRVDVGLPGDHSPETYHALSERLQDLLQEALLQPTDGGPEVDLRGMTCLVLGPLEPDETIDQAVDYEDNFTPVLDWLAYDEDDDEA